MFSASNNFAAGEGTNYERFFERFYQKDQSHNSEKAGFGIDFSMAQETVRTLKGSIREDHREGRITLRLGLTNFKGAAKTGQSC